MDSGFAKELPLMVEDTKAGTLELKGSKRALERWLRRHTEEELS
jgi:hypothetical protein